MQTIAIVGPGRLGSSLARSLHSAGYRIAELVSSEKPTSIRSARRLARALKSRASSITAARLNAEVVWFCLPDARIAPTARSLANRDWSQKIAIHSSGALSSDALASLRARGANVASVHPLMTFIGSSLPGLEDVSFAIEGDERAVRVASRIVSKLGGSPTLITPETKMAYHTFATIVCPLLVSLLAVAEQTASIANISPHEARRRILPIVRQTLANYERFGPAKSFTGPIIRGDAQTLRMHLRAISRLPAIQDVYKALASAALEYLPAGNRKTLSHILCGATPRTAPRSAAGKGRGRKLSGRRN